ncbi:MAG: ATP-binding cassette domain-containing protein [Acidobacteriia bacterium]|nr:ATP-binding cassette domain-containing protein [Terriglobia bacterium]MBV8905336.1 ATP-binding cassette domain-containing protein [Terriglobia bacterium]
MIARRRFFVPEAVQASGMDCGPASLKALLEGFGIHASYGRLREACQTDVDGSSIDTMEEVARQLGLDAEQIMLPADHLLLPEAQALPAIVIIRLPNGLTHFVVLWRKHGALLQLMDPATGRRWTTARRFLQDLYIHTATIPPEDWREWAASVEFQSALSRRLRNLGIREAALREGALADPGWEKIAALDAGVRFVETLARSGAVQRGGQSARLLRQLIAQTDLIPAAYWSVGLTDSQSLHFRGAILVRVRGKLPACSPETPELAAALTEKPPRPGRELLRLLRADGILGSFFLVFTLLLAAGAVILQAVLFRGLFDLGAELTLAGQRFGALLGLFFLLLLLLLLEYPATLTLLGMGRHLETRLRLAFLEKIPRLGDRYFKSRLKSDMSERSHIIYRIRRIPEMGGRLLRNFFELVLTAVGIAWIDPQSAPFAAAGAVAAVALPLTLQPAIAERDLRVRSHIGALCRYYLDALLGLVPIRVHGAQRAVRREHGSLLVEWAAAAFGLQRIVVWAEALQFTLGFGIAAALLLRHLALQGESGTILLLAYWALNMPVLGQEIASIAWQYPSHRNQTLRLLEPLGALEEHTSLSRDVLSRDQRERSSAAASVALEHVTIRASGHTILEDINVAIPAGAHVAVVGPSGAGKSSLGGTLLGFWRPSEGRVLFDGQPLDAENGRLEDLRRVTAWVDPDVHLWNRAFLENIRYGATNGGARPMAQVIEAAELRRVLEGLPDGLETRLGESGSLVSGGEGQRVRLARALFRPHTRLAILDEPFRGLDREQRRSLLRRVRGLWQDVTLLCITHDIEETQKFDRVLVIEDGRLAEDGSPVLLATDPDSRYRALLDAEYSLRRETWSHGNWRRLRLENGSLQHSQVPTKELA